MAKRRLCMLVVATVEVICPACGESQPNPGNGAFPWTPEEVKREASRNSKRECVSCDQPLNLQMQNKALMEAA